MTITTQNDLSSYEGYEDTFFNEIVYSDLDLRFIPHPLNGDIGINTEEKAVKSALKNLILTKPGEKAFDPKFGSSVAGQIFENIENDPVSIIESIRRSVLLYEQRITINDVKINILDYETAAIISIFFTIKSLKKESSIEIRIRGTR